MSAGVFLVVLLSTLCLKFLPIDKGLGICHLINSLVNPSCRWPSQWGGKGQEGGREAPGGRDCAGVPAGLSWRGVRRQPPVPWPRSLPAQVWQLLFSLALQECLLQSLLHQISLDTDTGGAKECVCSYICVRVCMCVGGDLCDGRLCVCVSVWLTEKVRPEMFWVKPPEGDIETSGS